MRKWILPALLTLAISMSIIIGLARPAISQSESPWVGGTIYIRADGSIEPSDAPIVTFDLKTYVITNDIQTTTGDGIVVERDNIILDGNGHTIRGIISYLGSGILIVGRTNITIKNLVITNFYHGIFVEGSTGITAVNNTITDNWMGIYLDSSSNNNIVNNTITSNYWVGIFLDGSSSNNNIVNNTITNNDTGIHLYDSSNNNIVNNTITSNYWMGIYLDSSSNNVIKNNAFIRDGLFVWTSYNNTVIDNTVNGKPLVYLEETSNAEVTGEAGQVIVIRSINITIKDLEISNTTMGIELIETQNTHIVNNTITSNYWVGIYLYGSSNNNIVNNTITNNNIGVLVGWYSQGNVFLYNSFVDNEINVRLMEGAGSNTWDDGRAGNYWSNHNCIDDDENGICDNPYVIRDPDNIDRYPLKYPVEKPVPTPSPSPTPTPTTTPSPTFTTVPEETSSPEYTTTFTSDFTTTSPAPTSTTFPEYTNTSTTDHTASFPTSPPQAPGISSEQLLVSAIAIVLIVVTLFIVLTRIKK